MQSNLLLFSVILLLAAFIHLRVAVALPMSVSSVRRSSSNGDASKLVSYQELSGPIAASFKPTKFNPVPWLSNCHLQTIGGFFLRKIPECKNVLNIGDTIIAIVAAQQRRNLPKHSEEEETTSFWDSRERIETPDNDWFHVDSKTTENSRGLIILLHGLESNSKSELIKEWALAYCDLGLDVTCISFRSCSGKPNDTIGCYNLGFTDDLKHYLELIAPDRSQPIYLSGFSLGANVMIKALGELKESAVDKYNIRGAAAFCVPLDCEINAPCLGAPGINRFAYTNTLLKSLKEKTREQLDRLCDGNEDTDFFDFKGAMNAETITDFDDAFVAPIYGYEDATDYYRKTSSIYFIDEVAVPLLILNAEDDPFMEPTYFPVEKSYEFGGIAPVKMVQSRKGGHCGFLFHQTTEKDPKYSWATTEMSRFVEHVMVKSTSLDS